MDYPLVVRVSELNRRIEDIEDHLENVLNALSSLKKESKLILDSLSAVTNNKFKGKGNAKEDFDGSGSDPNGLHNQ